MDKKKKVLGVVTNVIVIVILVFVCIVTLSIILSSGKGYTNLFGSAYVSVQSDSMEGTYGEDFPYELKGFNKGDLIQIKILDNDQKNGLKVGDVITFRQSVDGVEILNTHRIVDVYEGGYKTRGDKAPKDGATETVPMGAIVGQYEGTRLAGVGNVADFFHSSAGFFVCIVLPSLLIVAYFAVNLFLTVQSVKKAYKEEEQISEKEKMREELLRELREQGKIVEETPSEPAEQSETPAEEPSSEEETK